MDQKRPSKRGGESSEQFDTLGGSASGDSHRLGGLQQSVTYLEGCTQDLREDVKRIHDQLTSASGNVIRLQAIEIRLEKLDPKIEQLLLDVNAAKKLVWAFGGVLSLVGTLVLFFLNKIADVAIKHFQH